MGKDEITVGDIPLDETGKIIRKFWEKIIQMTTIKEGFWTSLEVNETDVSRDLFHSPKVGFLDSSEDVDLNTWN
jgi:hypothetical protein